MTNMPEVCEAYAAGFADGFRLTQRVLPATWNYTQAEVYDRGHEAGQRALADEVNERR